MRSLALTSSLTRLMQTTDCPDAAAGPTSASEVVRREPLLRCPDPGALSSSPSSRSTPALLTSDFIVGMFDPKGPVSSESHAIGVVGNPRHLECTVALALIVTILIVLPFFALVFYVVHQNPPCWFKFSTTILKLFTLTVEVSADERKRLPSDVITARSRDLPPASVSVAPLATPQNQQHKGGQHNRRDLAGA